MSMISKKTIYYFNFPARFPKKFLFKNNTLMRKTYMPFRVSTPKKEGQKRQKEEKEKL